MSVKSTLRYGINKISPGSPILSYVSVWVLPFAFPPCNTLRCCQSAPLPGLHRRVDSRFPGLRPFEVKCDNRGYHIRPAGFSTVPRYPPSTNKPPSFRFLRKLPRNSRNFRRRVIEAKPVFPLAHRQVPLRGRSCAFHGRDGVCCATNLLGTEDRQPPHPPCHDILRPHKDTRFPARRRRKPHTATPEPLRPMFNHMEKRRSRLKHAFEKRGFSRRHPGGPDLSTNPAGLE